MNTNLSDRPKRPIIFYYIIGLIVLLLINFMLVPQMNAAKIEKSTYGQFLEMLEAGEVDKVEVDSSEDVINWTDKDGQQYRCGQMNDYKLVDRLEEANITDYESPIIEQMSPVLSFILSWVLPIAVIYFLGTFLMRGMTKRMGGMGDAMSFGKSNAKVYIHSETGIKFKDVAGEEEAKELLKEIVDFLHNPAKYTEIGAKMPKGICHLSLIHI